MTRSHARNVLAIALLDQACDLERRARAEMLKVGAVKSVHYRVCLRKLASILANTAAEYRKLAKAASARPTPR